MSINTTLSKPNKDGFSFPAEWERHHGTLLMLPYRADIWNNGGKDARAVFLQMVKIISQYEKAYVVVDPLIYDEVVADFTLPNVKLIKMHYIDAWARDIMPIFVKKQEELRIVDFRFNAWGGVVDGLYTDYEADDLCKRAIANELGLKYYSVEDFVLEGGSVHTDGKKTLLTTEACLLSKGRNPKCSKAGISQTLKEYLGVERILYLPNGIVNDETNEHVDNMACFIDAETILVAYSEEEYQKKNSDLAINALANVKNFEGEPYKIVKMPTPLIYSTESDVKNIVVDDEAKKRLAGERLAASYVNYYIGNGFILFPQFGVQEDQAALEIIQSLYPKYDVYPIYSKEILIAGGNIHCVTQQIPEGGIYEG